MTEYSRLLLVILFLPMVGAGCVNYQSHYTVMKAETAGGDERQVRLSWRTADYPLWYGWGREATPIRMETQCSKRVWRLRDPGMEGACTDEGIAACGDPTLDVDQDRDRLENDAHVCVSVTNEQGSDRIVELGDRVDLNVKCFPRRTEYKQGDETLNADYPRASVVPYSLRVRTAPLGSLTQRPPELNDRICDLDE